MPGLHGTNQEFGRPYNRRIVLEAIRQHGPLTRADIAKRVGLTVQTVANITRELEDQDFITGARKFGKSRGQPPTHLSIKPDGGYAIGLYIAPLGIQAAIINLAGEIISKQERGRDCLEPERAFAEIADIVAGFRALIPGKRLMGVGFVMPGPLDVEGMSFTGPTTLEGWKGVPIQARLQAICGVPTFVDVDTGSAALGERLYGAGRSFKDFYFMHLGMGFGGCMVQDGLPVRGSFRNAGELGHVPVVLDGEPCPCGNRGCLERYVSIEAFERGVAAMGVDQWLDKMAPLFRNAIAIVENLYDPQTIIIGGAQSDMPRLLLERAQPLANTIASRAQRTAPRVMFSELGPEVTLLGAAALAIAAVLQPRLGSPGQADEGQPDPMFSRGDIA